MFFVSGITGKVGGAAARRLLEEGHQVRAIARDPAKAAEWSGKGVDVRRGDLNDAAAVATALEGVRGAFLMIPPVMVPAPGFPEVKAIIASYVEAMRRSPPPRLVLLSSVGSEQSSRLGNITTTHLMEQALADLPFPTAFVRAAAFIDNYAHGLAHVEATGVFHSLMQPTDRPFPMIATPDVGREVARLLTDDGWSGRKVVELGTPVSPDDLARAMSEVLGRPVEARAVPREQWAATLEQQGLPRGRTGLWEEMMDSFNSGHIAFGVPGTESVAGTTAPAEFFTRTRSA